MDLFETKRAGEVDLDDPEIYRSGDWDEHKTVDQLRTWAWHLLGQSLVYMDFLNPDTDWGKQRERVHGFCKAFAGAFWLFPHDTKEGRVWWRKFIWRFRDEVENQC
jgi:hypothetical protein